MLLIPTLHVNDQTSGQTDIQLHVIEKYLSSLARVRHINCLKYLCKFNSEREILI